MRAVSLYLGLLFWSTFVQADERPNILFFFADDWGRYAGCYQNADGSPSLSDVIKTPNIDRVAGEGVVFENAFVPVASCGPCRASLATGRYFWRCSSGAFLNTDATGWKNKTNPDGLISPFNAIPKFGDLLRLSGYHARTSGKTFAFKRSPGGPGEKAFGPVGYERYGLYVGDPEISEAVRKTRHDEVVENSRREIGRLLAGQPDDKPFFFTFGSINIHRPYVPDSGKALWGIEPDQLKGLIPPFLPDTHDVRRDFSDYLGEVMALDLMLGAMLEELEKAGALDNTLILLAGDHGIPGVPRGKTNCYDLACRVPMIARLPGTIAKGRRVQDFVSVMDVGPTLLDLAGVKVPAEMDGRSFLSQLESKKSGQIDPDRDHVIIGRERHVETSRPGNIPYPMRAVREGDFLYIRNFEPDRWPLGDPYEAADNKDRKALYELGLETRTAYRDLDGSLTKAFMLAHSLEGDEHAPLWKLTMGKRPSEELYDLRSDPHQLKNLADSPEQATVLARFRNQIKEIMEDSKDPRLTGAFDHPPYSVPGK